MQITIDIKTMDEQLTKPRAESTIVINMLKKTGISGRRALELYQQYGPDYIVRKLLHCEYVKPLDPRRYIQADLRDGYAESDGFHEWLKRRRTEMLLNENLPVEFRKIVGRIV